MYDLKALYEAESVAHAIQLFTGTSGSTDHCRRK